MKNHGMNPYLPSWEYVPDGEPHVFGKRVYIYGSHDRFAGYAFCQNDYVCWSAPVDDLTDWQYEGIIYTRAEAAHNEDGRQCLLRHLLAVVGKGMGGDARAQRLA